MSNASIIRVYLWFKGFESCTMLLQDFRHDFYCSRLYYDIIERICLSICENYMKQAQK